MLRVIARSSRRGHEASRPPPPGPPADWRSAATAPAEARGAVAEAVLEAGRVEGRPRLLGAAVLRDVVLELAQLGLEVPLEPADAALRQAVEVLDLLREPRVALEQELRGGLAREPVAEPGEGAGGQGPRP